MDNFISCDWGSSTFRLRLIDGTNMSVIAQELTSMGILRINQDWKDQETEEEVKRMEYYLDYVKKNIEVLEARTDSDLSGLPVILSGMASSTIGIEALPYGNLPFSLKQPRLPVKIFEAGERFNHPLWLVSGLRSDNDVLRGEEIQLLGLMQNYPELTDGLFIFPGTHSKHLLIQNGSVETIRTFMTGEVFGLLATHSMLAGSVEKHQVFSEENKAAFIRGVNDAASENILHAFFVVRTNEIFGKLSLKENYSYLSGLLIGTELAGIPAAYSPVYLCCESELRPWYELAFSTMGIVQAHQFSIEAIESAVTAGHYYIYKHQQANA